MSIEVFIRRYRALAISVSLFAISAFTATLFVLSFPLGGSWSERSFVFVIAAATLYLGTRLYRLHRSQRSHE